MPHQDHTGNGAAFASNWLAVLYGLWVDAAGLIPLCQHPKCGARMHRIYKPDYRKFNPCEWMYPDCKQMERDKTDS